MHFKFPGECLGDGIQIPHGLRDGQIITVQGKSKGSERFSINFQDKKDRENIAFHFNPRIQDGVVVRNTLSGKWQGEEREQPCFPFGDSSEFEVVFYVTSHCFIVYVNGEYFIKFAHRLPLSDGNFLNMGGAHFCEVSITNTYDGTYRTRIPNGMQIGNAFRFIGTCTGDEGFSLNFMVGEEFAFHFNPRPDWDVVVKNSKLGGEWGEEERTPESEFPFYPLAVFDAMFICSEVEFTVFVNQKEYTTYNHRCDFTSIDSVMITGAVNMKMLDFMPVLDSSFVKELPYCLGHGEQFVFRGFIKTGGDRFAINFMEGDDINSDIGFHFNPRCGQGQIVMNNRVGGGWQAEERVDLPEVFRESNVFELKIVAKKNRFKVKLDGKKLLKFMARSDVELIRSVNIAQGDAFIYPMDIRRKMTQKDYVSLLRPFSANTWVFVRGKVKKNCNRFCINFLVGKEPGGEIAFHYNPRFDGRVTVRNTLGSGGWQEEEREEPSFPFELGEEFEIIFKIESDKFETFVNGVPHISYNHRVDLDKIGAIQLGGDAKFKVPIFI